MNDGKPTQRSHSQIPVEITKDSVKLSMRALWLLAVQANRLGREGRGIAAMNLQLSEDKQFYRLEFEHHWME